MREHVAGTVVHVTIPSGRIRFHELENEICSILIECGWPSDESRSLHNLLIQREMVRLCLVVWRQARKHFEYEDAERIPVDALVVSRLTDDLSAVSVSSFDGKGAVKRTSGAR